MDCQGRLLHGLGWSVQKPERRAIATRRGSSSENARPGRASKKARRLGAHLVFVDESGFLLIPTVRRTWAPRGKRRYSVTASVAIVSR
jgi:hypothetical protein